jgi:hypothetical protein
VCHESVGLVARALDTAGIPTVSIFVQAFAHVADRMRLPRVVVTPHLVGRTVGPVGDRRGQREVVRASLRLLREAVAGEARYDMEPG